MDDNPFSKDQPSVDEVTLFDGLPRAKLADGNRPGAGDPDMSDIQDPEVSTMESTPDLQGEPYWNVLRRFHQELRPRTYFEIGTARGDSLTLAECPSIAVDPGFHVAVNVIGPKKLCAFYQMTSDEFFSQHDPKAILGGPIEMAFLDGMHRCEFLLRDFANVERNARKNSIVILHDCVPVETKIVDRVNLETSVEPHRKGWWLGDAWRTLLALQRRRPDLRITVLDAPPSGLACVTNLSPKSTEIWDNYADIVDEMLSWSLEDIGVANFQRIIHLEPVSNYDTHEKITRRFWL